MENDDPILARFDQHLVRIDEHMARANEHMARGNEHMARGNEIQRESVQVMRETRQVMRENTRAFEDLRAFLGEMTEVLHTLVRAVNENSAEIKAELREQRRAYREESQAGQKALLAILDQLRGDGPGQAPAT